ncbi:hypothetical protein AOX55_00005949 (plasmid) [Sinorhizobium fredii CCBAU 25509]|nr:hypothetical protein AOX55_00005949 [Sinorhizobium fredii CCBAU 25509]
MTVVTLTPYLGLRAVPRNPDTNICGFGMSAPMARLKSFQAGLPSVA